MFIFLKSTYLQFNKYKINTYIYCTIGLKMTRNYIPRFFNALNISLLEFYIKVWK